VRCCNCRLLHLLVLVVGNRCCCVVALESCPADRLIKVRRRGVAAAFCSIVSAARRLACAHNKMICVCRARYISITAEMATINRLWQDNYAEIRRVLRLSVPVSIGLLLNRMITFLSVIFVGHLGPAELAAASLGSSLLNILGLAVMAGLAGAITTLSGQV